jgi:hypothetical protein
MLPPRRKRKKGLDRFSSEQHEVSAFSVVELQLQPKLQLLLKDAER